MADLAPADADLDTPRRLLEAAGPIFARSGFRDATVREICAAAGVNVAAVHYHFGDKLELYTETLARCLRDGLARHPPDGGLNAHAPAPERLAAFVEAFLLRILGDGHPDWAGQLIAREMMDPTPALDRIVEEWIRPLFKQLCLIVTDLLGERATPTRVILCARSVVSQCVFYHHSRPVLLRLSPNEPRGEAHVRHLARHIAAFSLAALTHLPAERAR